MPSNSGMRMLAAVLGALILAAPASARIAVNRSIGGVFVGMTRTQVQGIARTGLDVTMSPISHRVLAVSTASATQRTRAGIGPGTSVARLLRVLRGVDCHTTLCVATGRTRVTTFTIRRGRIARVAIGPRWPSAL
jgi:hypothetical protein